MATDKQRELRIEAEKNFPGDRARQDAYIEALTRTGAKTPAKPKAKTPAKKKTARKTAPATRRRRF